MSELIDRVDGPEHNTAFEEAHVESSNGADVLNGEVDQSWHSEAGRKGAHRIHQLIEAGKLYEQEHGLKSGRQRLRQLIELGKVYEREHGLQPVEDKPSKRLSRMDREETLHTLLDCLVRIAKPSFRPELQRLIAALDAEEQNRAA